MVEIIGIVYELIENMLHSTIEGFVGVTGIFTYLAAIVAAAIYRIWENIQEDHH
ncbi:MAG: hypothetical protein RBR42_10740 [Desulfomicrobium sp.]|nr:hypothetical protein [Desulfomicrobium sp.]NLV97606.1 hypothetical protein [Desulfovibrionales bacterium]